MGTDYLKIIDDTDSKINEIYRKAQAEIAELKKPAIKASIELFSEIGWNRWDESQLDSEEQYTRFHKAFTDKMKIVSIDYENKCGQVRGSAIYEVSESGCTCGDCSVRRLPCKHMYFLAYQLSKRETSAEELQLTFDTVGESGKQQEYDFFSDLGRLGCCSLFRECSEKGHCLQSDEYYKQCGYRANLENGLAFYGKDSQNFSQDRYEYLLNYYDLLSADNKEIFGELITYFYITRRASTSCLCLYDEKIHDFLIDSPVFMLHPDSRLASFLFDADILQIKSSITFNKQHSDIEPPNMDYISNNNKLKDSTKTQLKRNALKRFYCDIDYKSLRELSRRFLYIGINRVYAFELDELFHDKFQNTTHEYQILKYFKYIKINPKASEEERQRRQEEFKENLMLFRNALS